MKLPKVLAVLIGIAVLACSTAVPAPAEPTPNIDATVEARVAQERAIDATVEARVAQEWVVEATVEARLKEEGASQPNAQVQPTVTPTVYDRPTMAVAPPTETPASIVARIPSTDILTPATANPTLAPTLAPTPKPTATKIRPTPAATRPPPTPPAPTLEPSRATSFGDGTWVVGTDILHGTYRSSKTGSNCYWERLRGFGGGLDDIIANQLTSERSVVEISSTDAGFSTENCGNWQKATTRITASPTSPFGDGTFIVGLDIAPGTWRSSGGDSCYWARLSGFSEETKHIKANDIGGVNSIVTIVRTDKGFSSSNCGTWTKQ